MPKPKPAALSLKTLRKLTTPQSFERGEDYFAQDTLTNLLRVGDRLQADCWGSQRYEVQATLGKDDLAEAYCTCPYDWGGLCKHLVALLLTYLREPEAFTVIEDLDALLESKSKADLVAFVKTIADQEPSVLRLLATQAALQTVTVEAGQPQPLIPLDSYRQQIRYIFKQACQGDPCDYSHNRYIACELGQFHSAIRQLQQKQDWTNAGRLAAMLIEEMNGAYDGVLQDVDYDGDITAELNNWAERLGDCFEQADRLIEPLLRESWFLTLLQAYFKDLEIGGIDYGWPSKDIILKHATVEEWETIEEEVKDRLNRSSRWSRESLVRFLQARREQDGNQGAAQALVRHLGTPQQQMWLCLEEGDFAQALTLMEEFLALPGLVKEVAAALVAAGQKTLALKLVQDAQQDTPNTNHLRWLSNYFRQEQDWAAALEAQVAWLKTDRFTDDDYATLREIAHHLDCWPETRSQFLEHFRAQHRNDTLIQLALAERDWDEAIRCYKAETQIWRQRQLGINLADAIKDHRPVFALEIYRQQVEAEIAQRNRKAYAAAARRIKIIKAVYANLEQPQAWATYIKQMRRTYARLPALQDELDKAGL